MILKSLFEILFITSLPGLPLNVFLRKYSLNSLLWVLSDIAARQRSFLILPDPFLLECGLPYTDAPLECS